MPLRRVARCAIIRIVMRYARMSDTRRLLSATPCCALPLLRDIDIASYAMLLSGEEEAREMLRWRYALRRVAPRGSRRGVALLRCAPAEDVMALLCYARALSRRCYART